MHRISPLVRISLGLVILTCSLIVALDFFGFVPDPAADLVEARIQLCETLAVHAAAAADRNDLASIRTSLQVAIRRNEDVLSAGLRSPNGRLLVSAGDHRRLWGSGSQPRSTHAGVPLFRKGRRWGTIEVRFASLAPDGMLMGFLQRPLVRLVLLVASFGFVTYAIYMRRTLRHLDPSAVIPTRVQAALDVMAEGVLLLDNQERIVLANAAFAERTGRPPASLLGVQPSSFEWTLPDSGETAMHLPWVESLRTKDKCTATRLLLRNGPEQIFSFAVKAVPVPETRRR